MSGGIVVTTLIRASDQNPIATPPSSPPLLPTPPPADASCSIKGNISKRGKIYHVPASASYEQTVIDTSKGECWFCTEAEAQAAGWRASQR